VFNAWVVPSEWAHPVAHPKHVRSPGNRTTARRTGAGSERQRSTCRKGTETDPGGTFGSLESRGPLLRHGRFGEAAADGRNVKKGEGV